MGISTGNIVCFVVAIGFLAFHTFLFINLSDQQQASLRRIDDLERLLKNATAKKSIAKTITSNCLEELQMRLDSELTNADGNVKVLRVLRKVQRLEKRVEKCIVRSLRRKRYQESRRPRRSDNSNSVNRYAVYTIWGVLQCPAASELVHTGQMVTTDGSDYLCLSDNPDDGAPRLTKTPGRKFGSSVSVRGVTYGDVEDVVNFFYIVPPFGPTSKNNKTVPCAVCARSGKSGSKMMGAILDMKKVKKFNMQWEYFGVLMASKESKKLICLSVDAKEYKNKKIKNMVSIPISNTVQIHPAELRCNSMYCKAGDRNHTDFYKEKYKVTHYYKEGYRVKCMVVTF